MGGKSSKASRRRHLSGRSAGSSMNRHGYPPQSPYPQERPYNRPRHQHAPPSPSPTHSHWPQTPQARKRFERKYSRILDHYKTLDQVTAALGEAGLESSNLIVGIDFTKSNEWTGKTSFHRKSLHHLGNEQNPYEQAISIIGKTLSAFDEDNLIPCYGFGDATTHDQDVFSFFPDDKFCNGFEEVLSRYRELVPQLHLAGPTSFAPIIEMATTIVEQSHGQYHVLLIIADGQVTRSADTQHGHLSYQEQMTIDAIVKASEFPLSIILVGVGDGPWEMMREFDDNIPSREFDNFQFVNFTEIMSKHVDSSTQFALSALMEIPSQYKATLELGLLGRRNGNAADRIPLPPPYRHASSFNHKAPRSSSFQPRESHYSRENSFQQSAPPFPAFDTAQSSSSLNDNKICGVCLYNPKDMAFGCGHQTCRQCGENLLTCPICRSSIQTRIRLY